MKIMVRLTLLLVSVSLTASLTGPTRAAGVIDASPRGACTEPDPCGYRWNGPQGPFRELPYERVTITRPDGVVLRGVVRRPVLPTGVKAPVVVLSSPYLGEQNPPGDSTADQKPSGGPPLPELVAHGYAVLLVSVRGTGTSSGCEQWMGTKEQDDQTAVVQWAARQTWSNGRVGMFGLSYSSATAIEAALQHPKALKTVVVAGTIFDPYRFTYSPQGAQLAATLYFYQLFFGVSSPLPPALGYVLGGQTQLNQDQLTYALLGNVGLIGERACPEVAQWQQSAARSAVTGDHDAPFWKDREFLPKMKDVRAATWILHGLQDRISSGHAFQADRAWGLLSHAPKRMTLGQWGHEMPYTRDLPGGDLTGQLLAWYDYWLKGLGDPPRLGTVDYQSSDKRWNMARSWPPDVPHTESLFLSAGKLLPVPGRTNTTFTSALEPTYGFAPACAQTPARVVFTSQSVTQTSAIAGNPTLVLELESDKPAGLIRADLMRIPSGGTCADAVQISGGAAQLEFVDDSDHVADPFPVDTPVRVRINLTNLAETLTVGDQIAVVLGFGDGSEWVADPTSPPTITLRPRSQMVLPLGLGSFGGATP